MFREAASLPDVAGATNVWNFVFGDEATYIYMATQFDNQIRTTNYEADMANLRSVLLNNPTGYVVPVMFQVQSYLNELKKFYQAIENGEGTYFPPFGLADKTSEVKFYYDVEDGITYAT